MKKRWLIQAISGILLTGTGLSMAIDAGFEKFQGNPYLLYGTFSLIIFMAGINLIIDADNYKK
ncbi:MAG: hypothetical protein RIR51_1075 [Bacteroidota bacterium]|jgi:hypothetical protein